MNPRTFTSQHRIADETSALRYVSYILSCARSVRLGPLAEHLTRSLEAAPAEARGVRHDPCSSPSLDEHLAAYAEKYDDLVTGFTWSAASGSEEHPVTTGRAAGDRTTRPATSGRSWRRTSEMAHHCTRCAHCVHGGALRWLLSQRDGLVHRMCLRQCRTPSLGWSR